MPPGAHPLFEGQFSPLGTLAMYSRVLADAAARLAAERRARTGCVFYNGPEGLDAKLEEFLAAGPPPVVFTLGTSAVGAAGRFYHESAAAAARLGMRAVLLTGGIEQNKPDGPLPDSVLLVDRAPHQLLFPRAAAVVHQVGAGTLGQALRSGKPMLAVPHGHDQFDNALRVDEARRRAHACFRSSTRRRASRASSRCCSTRAIGSARRKWRRSCGRKAARDAAAAAIETLLG